MAKAKDVLKEKISITFRSDREYKNAFDAVEEAMDHFDNGTWQMNALRKLVGRLANAWNARIDRTEAASK